MAWHCTTYYCCCLHRCCLCPSFVATELVSLGRRISADTGCGGCRRVERTVLCEAHTYTAAPTSSKNAKSTSWFLSLEVFIEVPFRKNINGNSAFGLCTRSSANHVEIPCWKVCAKFRGHRRDNKWISSDQPMDFSTLCSISWWHNTIRNDP